MQLYVGNLSADTTEVDVEGLFSDIYLPPVVTIIRDIDSGKSKGFAIVKIQNQEKGEEAIRRLNGITLWGRNIVVRRMPETLPGEMELREWLAEHASEVLKHIGVKQAQTVLDYGCGSGTFTIPSAIIVGKRGKVYAFEARSSLLERVREKAREAGLSNIETILSDSSKPRIALSDKCADIILVYDVMHEIGDRQGLLQELRRVLKDDGILSVFPMHIGTESFIDVIREYDLFSLSNRYGPPGFKAASEILNFIK
ncbi:MAG TPA: methyltransferase domain-containing protein [Dehalococcoidia bacterium]|nr:methyltransferase domain-containing protein [Dehalococcoidia bacterium]